MKSERCNRFFDLGAICHEHGILFHTDAVQWLAKAPV